MTTAAMCNMITVEFFSNDYQDSIGADPHPAHQGLAPLVYDGVKTSMRVLLHQFHRQIEFHYSKVTCRNNQNPSGLKLSNFQTRFDPGPHTAKCKHWTGLSVNLFRI